MDSTGIFAATLALAAGPAWATPASGADTPAAQVATNAAPGFDVWEYQVAGNLSLPAQAIEKAVYPHLGPQRTLDDVEAARAALEQAYRDAGYGTALVNIPEQDVEEGLVRLDVVEGRIGRLRVTGSRYFSLGRIRSHVPALAEGGVPHLPSVQAQLANVNTLSADRSITPVLKAGRTPGTVDAELQVQDRLPLHGSLELSDRYTRDTTRPRLNGSIRYDNLWQREHGVTFSYQVAPEDRSEVEVYSGNYLFRVPSSDALVVLYGVNSNSDVATVGTLGVVGQGMIIGARGIVPLAPRESYFHNLTLGIDYKDFDESIDLQGSDSLNTPISYSVLTAGYSGTWRHDLTSVRAGIDAHFAWRGLGNGEQEFEDKRFRSDPNLFYLTALLELERDLPGAFALVARLDGQLAGRPLISNEQFNVGGADSVRGYLESQELADDGLQGTVELRSPPLARHVGRVVQDLRLHGFVDGARIRVVEPLPGDPNAGGRTLFSAGLGVTAIALDGLQGIVEWAYPFADGSNAVRRGDERLHLSVGYEF